MVVEELLGRFFLAIGTLTQPRSYSSGIHTHPDPLPGRFMEQRHLVVSILPVGEVLDTEVAPLDASVESLGLYFPVGVPPECYTCSIVEPLIKLLKSWRSPALMMCIL